MARSSLRPRLLLDDEVRYRKREAFLRLLSASLLEPVDLLVGASQHNQLLGRPHSWVKVDDGEGLSFEPTPGPGDSEGGDLYPP